MIKAIVFDVDGVLIDSLEANIKFIQDLMRKAGYKPPTRKQYTAIFHLNMMDVIKHLTKSQSEKEIKRIWKIGASRDVAYPTELIKIPKDAEETIKLLSKKYLLAIVTNRVKAGLYEIPQLAKLKRYFKVAVSYEDTINHKPHPEPLLLAAKRLGVNPNESVYVGDAESDIKAARATGMKIISYPKRLERADAWVSSFKELSIKINSL